MQKCSPFCYAKKGVLLDGMTAKQRRFCDEYLIDLNATQAAIRSGYSEKTAYRTGADNLRKPQIREYIDQRMAEKEAEEGKSLDERITSTEDELTSTQEALCEVYEMIEGLVKA